MKLIEALQIVQETPRDPVEPFQVFLACGFTPLHLKTFLGAHFRVLHPNRGIEIQTGLFGDLRGNLERIEKNKPDASAVLLEWADFDPRLGFYSLGGWKPGDLAEILDSVRTRTQMIVERLQRLSEKTPVVICMPTLPLPPISFTPGWLESGFEIQLREGLSGFGGLAARGSKIRFLNPRRLDLLSPLSERLDVKSYLQSGFPYKTAHASSLAELLARLIYPSTPKKGLITDLDNTFWQGILGEVGAQGISWDWEHQSQVHGLYQQMLQSLSEAGVLLAVASKNSPEFVDEAFQRPDLLLSRDRIYPMEVHWGLKSESVRRILGAWNVGSDSVVFIDDSPMEVAEVQQAFPEMECVVFPTRSPQAIYELLGDLRDRFGKETLSSEDSIRLDSLRRSAAFRGDAPPPGSSPGGSMDDFLEQAKARITVSAVKHPSDPRAYELINKTNQFNLNGKRYSEAAWQAHLDRPDTFLLVVSYQDKYGPLGKIAVITGSRNEKTLFVNAWVMSCRAFSRRIEHGCLRLLFDKFDVDEIAFDFQPTPGNSPFLEFLAELLDNPLEPGRVLPREVFSWKSPRLFHQVEELN